MLPDYETEDLTSEIAEKILADHEIAQKMIFPFLSSDMIASPSMILNPSDENTEKITSLKLGFSARLLFLIMQNIEDKYVLLASQKYWKKTLQCDDFELEKAISELANGRFLQVYMTALGQAFYPNPGVMFFPNKNGIFSGKFLLLPEEAQETGIHDEFVKVSGKDLIIKC